jgi:hypothetical protein
MEIPKVIKENCLTASPLLRRIIIDIITDAIPQISRDME